MKKTLVVGFLILAVLSVLIYIINNSEDNSVDYNSESFLSNSNDPIFESPEKTIEESLIKAIKDKNIEVLSVLENKLKEEYDKNKTSLAMYWKAYIKYATARYYDEVGKKKNTKNEILKGIEILEGIENKNSDDYALLGMLQGFAIKYLKNQDVILYNIKAKKNINKALKLDSTNVRAHYVAANHDLYTPKEFGGGKIVEKHLNDAISIALTDKKNSFAPTWGKMESYLLLVDYYIQKDDLEKASDLREALKKEYSKSQLDQSKANLN
ncbi:hypothetical protein [Maribacter sp. IgM3_T14_3]|uniref:hypothetical protein n=1 Tax=Maribacter sp. IgM3_T14_3 TaxID=3415140 RepID=UPI003C6F2EC7